MPERTETPDARQSIRAVGSRLRAFRKARGLTLQDLRDRSGLSLGLLSQLERGKANPSFTTLIQLAQALDVTLTELIAYDSSSPVVAREDRPHLGSHGGEPLPDGITAELLTPGGQHSFEVTSLVMQPGYSTEGKPFTHGGEEFGLVLSGRHEVYLEDELFVLGPGDSITFDAQVPHWYRNPGPEPVTAFWVVTF